ARLVTHDERLGGPSLEPVMKADLVRVPENIVVVVDRPAQNGVGGFRIGGQDSLAGADGFSGRVLNPEVGMDHETASTLADLQNEQLVVVSAVLRECDVGVVKSSVGLAFGSLLVVEAGAFEFTGLGRVHFDERQMQA